MHQVELSWYSRGTNEDLLCQEVLKICVSFFFFEKIILNDCLDQYFNRNRTKYSLPSGNIEGRDKES